MELTTKKLWMAYKGSLRLSVRQSVVGSLALCPFFLVPFFLSFVSVCVSGMCVWISECVWVWVCVCARLFVSFLSFFLFFLHWDPGAPHKGLYRGVWWGRAWCRRMWIHGRQGTAAAAAATGWPGSWGGGGGGGAAGGPHFFFDHFFFWLSLSIYI